MSCIDDFRNQKADNNSEQLTIIGSIDVLKAQILECDEDMEHIIGELLKLNLGQKHQLLMFEGIQRYLHAKKTKYERLYNFKVVKKWG